MLGEDVLQASWTSRVSSRLHTVGPGVVDTGLVSLRNFGVSVLAARAMDLSSFGQFSLVVLLLLMATGMSRALHADPIVLAGGGVSSRSWRRRVSAAASAAMCSSVIVAALFALVVVLMAPQDLGPLVAGACVLPLVLVHDTLRMAAHYVERGWLAVSTSMLALVTCGGAAIIAEQTALRSGASCWVVVWAAGAVPAAAVLARQLGCDLNPMRVTDWYRDEGRLAARLVADWALLQATAEGAFVLVGTLTASTDLGNLRKAQLPLAPMIVLSTGFIVFLQPVLRRALLAGESDSALRIATFKTAVGVTVATGSVALCAALLPTGVMNQLVGGDWETARPYFGPLVLALLAGAAGGALGVGLRVSGGLSRQLALRCGLAPVTLAATAWAASTSGALAAVWCVAVSAVIVAVTWGILLAVQDPVRSTKAAAARAHGQST